MTKEDEEEMGLSVFYLLPISQVSLLFSNNTATAHVG